nr:hypothetical protein [Hyphomonas pacifica]
MSLPSDLHEDLAQVPLPLRTLPHTLRPALADLTREVGAEALDPMLHRFVASINPSLMEQVFGVAQ